MDAGGDEEDGGLNDAVGDAGASSNSTAPPLSLTARIQAIEHELQRFRLEKGLDDDIDNENTGGDDQRVGGAGTSSRAQPWLDWPRSI